jgi:plasmid stabilization system protein ParE
MNYRVEVTERAGNDLDRILRNLWERSPNAFRKLSARFEQTVARLENNPLAFGLAFENPRFAEVLRHALFGTHPKRKCRALFVVREDVVVILAIRAPGEKPWKPEEPDSP